MTIAVHGLREFQKACTDAPKHTRKEIREAWRPVGDVIRHKAGRTIATKDTRSAAGLRTRVRQRGIAVEQSLRKTTGVHPDWGAWQMRRALLPARADSAGEVIRATEHALDEVKRIFERKP